MSQCSVSTLLQACILLKLSYEKCLQTKLSSSFKIYVYYLERIVWSVSLVNTIIRFPGPDFQRATRQANILGSEIQIVLIV